MSLIMPDQPENISKTPALVIRYNVNYASFYEHFKCLPIGEMPISQLTRIGALPCIPRRQNPLTERPCYTQR